MARSKISIRRIVFHNSKQLYVGKRRRQSCKRKIAVPLERPSSSYIIGKPLMVAQWHSRPIDHRQHPGACDRPGTRRFARGRRPLKYKRRQAGS